jgi:hypothetical protein
VLTVGFAPEAWHITAIYVMVAVYPLTSAQEGMAATLAAAQGCQLLTFSGDTARPAVLS